MCAVLLHLRRKCCIHGVRLILLSDELVGGGANFFGVRMRVFWRAIFCACVYFFLLQAHHLLYGGGFQTWEYSPTYALRSYGYILIHMFPLLATNTTNKVYIVNICLPNNW